MTRKQLCPVFQPNDRQLGTASVLLLAGLCAFGCARDESVSTAGKPSVAAATATAPTAAKAPAYVDGERIINADSEPGNWMSHGRTYDEERFSPLTQIDTENVRNLGLSWHYDLPTHRGLEATPVVVDGKMFLTGSWSRVYALDAANGELLWEYDPKVPPATGAKACCDVVNRGVAVWKGRVYVGTLDGRLIALEADSGELAWSVQTTPTEPPYTITGAPRVVKDKVIIGNGGAEMGVRGYVSAYNADTGDQAWRFYTVPGNPDEPFENPALEMAAKTWSGGEWWKNGGGGTVWDSMSYDPELDLLYIGSGNGSPWSRKLRSPGGGDNLFLSSIIALRPDTGEYVWHYQTAPGDSWDYASAQHMILTELKIDGVERKVIMQAPKNGIFYVLDRETGQFISGNPFVTVNWIRGFDPATGRPDIDPRAYYTDEMFMGQPSTFGAHTWQPMSYHPGNNLVYIPALDSSFPYVIEENFRFLSVGVNVGVDGEKVSWPEDPVARQAAKATLKGLLIAWDPVKSGPAWTVRHKVPWNGGVVSTAGNLLFQGNGEGDLVAYRADSGERLWSFPAQTGIVAPPITYTVNGEQYITVLAGWGGSMPLVQGGAFEDGNAANRNVSRVLAFKLGGKEALPELPPVEKILDPPANTASEEQVARGKALYHRTCFACHGDAVVSGGVLPDLRYTNKATHKLWDRIVLEGLLTNAGMVSFASILSEQDSHDIQAYVIKRTHDTLDLDEVNEPAHSPPTDTITE
ncbi:PQQ-dependent dehydrogenase, methanol/ethanol family [Parahaliea mediterranea]|uniref:PQQ-dependent dehydrogenase, methanol/ethanol family n=1 Tax=Parahaliea mediterranea TaxID=651086 RepID=UPI001F4D6A4F|nr:PQQ-dependent dehydrogenase, methanol/ethanol family [Parahaliea mediterranea]